MLTNVLFIMGALRSGSTVFEQHLARAAGTMAAGEVAQVWTREQPDNRRCTCGETLDACPVWTGVMAGVERQMGGPAEVERIAGQLSFDLARLRSLPATHHRWLRSKEFSRRYRDEVRLLNALYGQIAQVTGTSLILDGSKAAAYGHLLGALESTRVAYVFLIRDSRAVVHSWRRGSVRTHSDGRLDGFAPWPHRHAVRHWIRENLAGCALVPYAGSRMIAVTYEEFVRSPEQTVRRVNGLLSRLGMPGLGEPDPDGLLHRYHALAGNPVRFDPGAPLIEDVRWRREMPIGERLTVTLATAPGLLAHHVLLRRHTGHRWSTEGKLGR